MLSGGNIDVSFIHKIVERAFITRCRQLKFSVLMPDAPGALEHFSHIVAQQNANIILFQHDRVQTDLSRSARRLSMSSVRSAALTTPSASSTPSPLMAIRCLLRRFDKNAMKLQRSAWIERDAVLSE